MQPLLLVSCMAPAAAALYPGVAAYLERATGIAVRCEAATTWEARMALLDAGEAALGHICGAQYLPRAAALEPLAAPVPLSERYDGRPVYFSDVVVRTDAPFARFEDLGGARWAYNEPTSHSGYGVVAWALARQGLTWDWFGEVVQAGSHEAAVALVLAGDVDAAAIDSTVLALATAHDASLASRLRVVASLGPSPSPPLVVARSLPRPMRDALRGALASMHTDAAGTGALQRAGLARFATVADAAYDDIREMTAVGVAAGRPSLHPRG